LNRLLKLLIINCSLLIYTLSVHAQGLWTQRASLPDSARGYGISFSIGNCGYVGLGIDQNIGLVYLKDFWQFNSSNNTWSKKTDFPGLARICPATFVIGHKAYVVTGQDTNYGFHNECWEYDATINKWTQKANFPGAARAYDFGFSIGNKGFIGMGSEYEVNYYKDFWEYDTTSDTWTRKVDFGGIARITASGFSVGNKGYACFGLDSNNSTYNDLWEYDTGKNSWTQKMNKPGSGLSGQNGFVIGNNIYIGTGDSLNSLSSTLKNIWKYNTLLDSWTQEATFAGGVREASISFAIGDSGYLGAGVDSSANFYNDLYKFYPDTLTAINEITDNENSISVYPNPSNGLFILQLGINNYELRIEVYNILGEIVYEGTVSSNEGKYEINLSNTITGVYTLKAYCNNRIHYKKLIVVK
jgi:N-acetylneuraminic acid mutarotase